jgi:peptidoglycan/LPS O-acetylase OafA/YrhL
MAGAGTIEDSSETAQSTVAGQRDRVYYIDWLRLMAVLLLFFFHTARVFDPEEFYIHGIPKRLRYSRFDRR